MKHILAIDDNPGDVHLVREALTCSGLSAMLHVGENAVQAYNFLYGRGDYPEHPLPDLILLDISMPVIKGKEALKTIRSEAKWARIPIIILTSSALDADREECLRLGATAYVVKPNDWQGYLTLFKLVRIGVESGIYKV